MAENKESIQKQNELRTQKAKLISAKLQSRKGIYDDVDSHFAVTIGKTPREVFQFYRNFENLPYFMKDLKSISVLSEKKSHWVVEIDLGLKAEWDAIITSEKENEMISWKSTEDSEVKTSGTIWFKAAPQGLGTVVSLALDYSVPGGKLTEWLTRLRGEDPDSLAFINLRRLKCYLEAGELATTKGQTTGREEDLESTTKH